MSFLGPKTASIKYAKGYKAVLKQLGYRLRVTELKLTPCADGVCAELTVANEGAAPFYWEWPVNLYVEDAAGNTLYTACLPLSLPELMPGDSQKHRSDWKGRMQRNCSAEGGSVAAQNI